MRAEGSAPVPHPLLSRACRPRLGTVLCARRLSMSRLGMVQRSRVYEEPSRTRVDAPPFAPSQIRLAAFSSRGTASEQRKRDDIHWRGVR